MRKIVKALLAAASVFGMGNVVILDQANAATFAEKRAEADRACEEALKDGSIEALEKYLQEYWWAPNECRARAFNALGEYDPQNFNNERSGDSESQVGGYSQ
jgi:hypothetical protein